MKYVVGRLQYAARLEGNVHVGTQAEFIPVVSFTGVGLTVTPLGTVAFLMEYSGTRDKLGTIF